MEKLKRTFRFVSAGRVLSEDEKNPLFAAKPRFRELWKREKRGKGGEKEGKEERGKERDPSELMNQSSNFIVV